MTIIILRRRKRINSEAGETTSQEEIAEFRVPTFILQRIYIILREM